MKGMAGGQLSQERIHALWQKVLTEGDSARYSGSLGFHQYRTLMKVLPKNPRCKLCNVPFSGIGGTLARTALGRERSNLNPSMCNICEKFARQHQGGAEVEISMLFADVRGSTAIAERMTPLDFSRLIDRFYQVTTDLLVEANAWIEKMIGDEVTGLFIPGFAGSEHARVAVETAQAILRATGHGRPEGAWIPVGVGVNTGQAFVGAVGKEGGITDITALGDSVNTAARLAAKAGPGEILITQATCTAAQMNTDGLETRELELKGKSGLMSVWVLGSH